VELVPQQGEVWRVEWNVTGTVLSCSADDGAVRMWRANSRGNWELFSVISPTQQQQ
jgi:nucleoporin SEH1